MLGRSECNLRKPIKKLSNINTKKLKQSSLDGWLNRLSHLSQIGLLITALFGYIYTVLPVYQKSLLDEQIAQKELELRQLQIKLDKAYILNRTDAIKKLYMSTTFKCNGLNMLPKNSAEYYKNPKSLRERYGQILQVEPQQCLIGTFQKARYLQDTLKAEDYQMLSLEIGNIAESLNKARIDAKDRFNELPAKALLNPQILDSIKLDFLAEDQLKLYKLRLSKADYEAILVDELINKAMSDISSQYSKVVYEELKKLLNIQWVEN